MKIDNELILKLEKLSRLSLNEDERTQIMKDLENILDMVEKLQELDTTGVDPLKYMTKHHIASRDDIPIINHSREAMLNQAPKRKDDYFLIPKVIKK